MLKVYQSSITKPITFEGTGLHSGKKVKLKILPAKEDEGIIFKRIDLKKNNLIIANYNNVISTKLCTTLQNSFGAKISTVEHLLAAIYISQIDNAIVEVDSDEIPIMDGSAKTFVETFQKTGLKTLNKKRKYLRVLRKYEFVSGNKKISIEPNDYSLEISFKLDYKNKVIGKQKNMVNFEKDELREVYESRTFCLFDDIEKIKKLGLAKGGTLNNAVVVDSDKVLNIEGLRNKKEFVNHKILDLAGDFLLSGFRVLGNISCQQGGHELTNDFLKKMLSQKSLFESVELKNIKISSKVASNQLQKIAVNA